MVSRREEEEEERSFTQVGRQTDNSGFRLCTESSMSVCLDEVIGLWLYDNWESIQYEGR